MIPELCVSVGWYLHILHNYSSGRVPDAVQIFYTEAQLYSLVQSAESP